MKVAVAVSALAETDPASSSRKSDQGPVRSSIDGWPLASSLAEIAVRIDVPGHWTFVGVTVTGCGGGARENRLRVEIASAYRARVCCRPGSLSARPIPASMYPHMAPATG